MSDVDIKLPEIFLMPGEFHVARGPAILKTLLGSCVGVTFWNERLGVGALCHGVLPKIPRGVHGAEAYRYVDFVIRDLVGQFEGLGVLRSEMQIKLFGGADVLPVLARTSPKSTVGYHNWNTALEVLSNENLTVVASDLGGLVGRTIHFYTGTGEVLLRRHTQVPPEGQRQTSPEDSER